MSDFVGLYMGCVSATSKRKIKCNSGYISSNNQTWILPLEFGTVKFPTPEKGDYVLIFNLDGRNQNRFYIPVPKDEKAANDDQDDSTKIILGDGATEKAVLGDTLKTKLEGLIDGIIAETHPTAIGPTGSPINVASFTAIKTVLSEILSVLVKLK